MYFNSPFNRPIGHKIKNNKMRQIYFTLIFLMLGGSLSAQVKENAKDSIADKLQNEATETAVISLNDADLGEDEESQYVSGFLQASNDLFLNTAGFGFGAARFRVRGYGSEYSSLYMNGIKMNDIESGRAFWTLWGGLNDATRNKITKRGITPSKFGFGSIGGSANIITRAAEYRKGFKASKAFSNKSYTNRLMLTYSSGLMANGWAFTLSGSRRWANEGYVEGTFYDAWAYLFAIEKKFDKHSIYLTAFGAPQRRGKQGGSTLEAYNLTGNNYYNPYWGYQNGEKRNSRIAHYNKPVILLGHSWEITPKVTLNTTVNYIFGEGGGTALNWYNANDPRPDYYRNLPSYIKDDPLEQENKISEWKTNENIRQLNWEQFYFANTKNLAQIENVDGIEGKTLKGYRSKYIIEDRRDDIRQLTGNMTVNAEINQKIMLSGGASYTDYTAIHFKEIDDLLGGDFWVDVDQFAERDFADPQLAQSDLNHPQRCVKEGDKFGYDYETQLQKADAWAQAEIITNKVDFYIAGAGVYTNFRREGKMRNGKFPENSYGKSKNKDFFDYKVKGGATYKISGRHYITSNNLYMTQAPVLRNVFVSPRTREQMVDGLKSETILSSDLIYRFRTPIVKGSASVYYSQIKKQAKIMSFYHDEEKSFVNYIMNGIDKKYMGAEFAAEVKISPTLSLNAVGAYGQYSWDSRPHVTIVKDNSSKILVKNETVYVKDFYETGTPQTAVSAGLNYSSPHYWWIAANINYFDDIYLSFNPARRTEKAIINVDNDTPVWNNILQQEKLSGEYTVDIKGGKSWKVGNYYIGIFVMLSNILDNQDFRTGGYEQLRFDYRTKNIDKYPPKYFYMYGRNYYAMITLRF